MRHSATGNIAMSNIRLQSFSNVRVLAAGDLSLFAC